MIESETDVSKNNKSKPMKRRRKLKSPLSA
jgi:hypothetical protein